MAEIPSALPAAAAQAVHRSREISKDDESHRAGETHIAQRNVKTIDEASAVVDTDDADNRVFSDSEGLGSQGREDNQDEDDADSETNSQASTQEFTRRPDGSIEIDLQA